jgi:hypothetical protein
MVSSLNGYKSGRILDPVVDPGSCQAHQEAPASPFGSRRLVDGLACAPMCPDSVMIILLMRCDARESIRQQARRSARRNLRNEKVRGSSPLSSTNFEQ